MWPKMHILPTCVCVCVCARAYVHIFSHVWLFATMDCSLPDSSVHGIFQARILKWVTVSFSRGSSQPRNGTCISCTRILEWIAISYFRASSWSRDWTFHLLHLLHWQADSLPQSPRGKPKSLLQLTHPPFLAQVTVFVIFVGLLSGSYKKNMWGISKCSSGERYLADVYWYFHVLF